MKRLLQILTIAIILSSCNRDKGLEGLWYAAYTVSDSKKEVLYEPTLFEFKGDQLFTIKIRDLATGELGKVSIDTSTFEIVDSTLKFETYSPTIHFSKDSIVLNFEKPNQTLVLRKIPVSLRPTTFQIDCFDGSFYVKGKNYQDSIDFVNDSLLIYTGEYEQNFPGKKWQIVDYDGFKFLNIHEELQPVTIIKLCNAEGIELIYPSIQSIDIKLIPTSGQVNKEQLFGSWKEVKNSYPKLPTPPNLSEKDLFYSIDFQSDLVEIEKYGRVKEYKWDLTSDGKRIYFLEEFLENQGSWKLLELSDTLMTVRISSQSGLKEEIVKFKKENSR